MGFCLFTYSQQHIGQKLLPSPPSPPPTYSPVLLRSFNEETVAAIELMDGEAKPMGSNDLWLISQSSPIFQSNPIGALSDADTVPGCLSFSSATDW